MNYFGAHAEHSVYQLDQMMEKQGKEEGKITKFCCLFASGKN